MEKTEHNQNHEIPIIIDKKQHKTVSPTSGASLYLLGVINTGYDLFRETAGQGDDLFVPNDATTLDIHPGDHFYSAQSSLNPGA